MPKIQIPPEDAKDSKKVVEHIQKAVQSQLSSGKPKPDAGIYVKF
jgi:hypothetical protein